MRQIWKLLSAAGLCAGLGLTVTLAGGQPPEKGPPPGDRPPPPPGGPGRPGGERRPEPRPDPQVDAWLKTLADKITDPHDTIRDSARAGIVAAGPAALPMLFKLAEGADGAKATAALKLIAAIERGEPRPGAMAGGGPVPPPFGDRGERPGQPDQPRGERPDRQRPGGTGRVSPMEQAFKELGLNEKQQRQAQEIREAHEPKMREIMEQAREGRIDPAEAREKREKVREELMKELKDVLTEEQFEKLHEVLRKNGPPGGRGGPDGDRRPDGPGGDRPPRPGGDERR